MSLRIQGAVYAALVCCALAACQGQDQAPLRIGMSLWPPNEMAFLASEQGFFDGADIDLIESAGPTAYLPGYLDGGLDAAMVSLGTALELVDVEPQHRIVMLLDYSRGGDALVARADAAMAGGLRGKRVGFESTPLSAYLLTRLLGVAGLEPDDVTLVHLDNASFEQAFDSGKVDAVVAWQPVVNRLVDAGGVVVADSGSFPEEIVDVLVVRAPTLQQKRAQFEAFAAGWFRALALHRKDPMQAAAASEQRGHVSVANYLASFDDVIMLDLADNLRLMADESAGLIEALEMQRAFLTSAGLLRTQIDVHNIIDISVLRALP